MYGMRKILPFRRSADLTREAAEPNPAWTLAVGLLYVFRTRPGQRIVRELEAAVRKYAADPSALWALIRDGEEVIDTTLEEAQGPTSALTDLAGRSPESV
jgi:hypothetical protein